MHACHARGEGRELFGAVGLGVGARVTWHAVLPARATHVKAAAWGWVCHDVHACTHLLMDGIFDVEKERSTPRWDTATARTIGSAQAQ